MRSSALLAIALLTWHVHATQSSNESCSDKDVPSSEVEALLQTRVLHQSKDDQRLMLDADMSPECCQASTPYNNAQVHTCGCDSGAFQAGRKFNLAGKWLTVKTSWNVGCTSGLSNCQGKCATVNFQGSHWWSRGAGIHFEGDACPAGTVGPKEPVIPPVHTESLEEIAAAQVCKGNTWIGIYSVHPEVCHQEISSRDDCSKEYFNHATNGDGNCGCIKPGTDCSKAGELSKQAAVRVYHVESVALDRLSLRGLPCSQSSDAHGGTCDRAIDGNFKSSYGESSCTHTNNEEGAWWKVTLPEVHDIASLSVTNRGDCCGERLDGFKVLVDGKECASNQKIGKGRTELVTCESTGREVQIELSGKNALTLCEVTINGVAATPTTATPTTTIAPTTTAPITTSTTTIAPTTGAPTTSAPTTAAPTTAAPTTTAPTTTAPAPATPAPTPRKTHKRRLSYYWRLRLKELGVPASDIQKLTLRRGPDGKTPEFYYGEVATGIGNGRHEYPCPSTVVYCAGGHNKFGWSKDRVEAIKVAIQNGGVHPEAPRLKSS